MEELIRRGRVLGCMAFLKAVMGDETGRPAAHHPAQVEMMFEVRVSGPGQEMQVCQMAAQGNRGPRTGHHPSLVQSTEARRRAAYHCGHGVDQGAMRLGISPDSVTPGQESAQASDQTARVVAWQDGDVGREVPEVLGVQCITARPPEQQPPVQQSLPPWRRIRPPVTIQAVTAS
ncbi:hypothetical protein BP6252_05612 [Coleophoma cylindrospora]|uniref:Uncharacterized protein n=1 Tax=Coleophoma cylindrospora TaxID=1849047 RepID=A0A3D8RU28_9HELO|nr:hypothetical protein BP6252_05612 [Coleophoma cylindrospora]